MDITTPVTGTNVASLSSPTYTLTEDTAPGLNGIQYAVTALGGTQADVDAHSVSKPFTVSVFRPQTLRTLPQANNATGVITNVPMNNYKLIVRKGAEPAANQIPQVATATVNFRIPAGSDTYEAEQLAAMVSLLAGIFNTDSDALYDLLVTGVL
jgi:acetylornithine deacetylase/succinyl-diaminopimelate desuccinylase-like protein